MYTIRCNEVHLTVGEVLLRNMKFGKPNEVPEGMSGLPFI